MLFQSWLQSILGAISFGVSSSESGIGAGGGGDVAAPADLEPDVSTSDQPDGSVAGIPVDVDMRGWSKSIDDCHECIRRAYPLVKSAWEAAHPGWTLKCDYTYRSPAFQFELYKKGRAPQNGTWVVVDKSSVVTDKDGKSLSHHNVYPAQAADVYIVNPAGAIVWNSIPLYAELGGLWVARGLVSGATWKYSWKDADHVQVDYPII